MSLRLKQKDGMSGAVSSAALFCVFAFLALAVILFGARSYRSLAQRLDDNFTFRTISSYLSNKVRQHDAQGAVALSEIGGTPALALTEEGGEFCTLIYFSGGAVREVYSVPGLDIDPSTGMEIAGAEGLSFDVSGGGVTYTLRYGGGQERSVFLAVRSTAEP